MTDIQVKTADGKDAQPQVKILDETNDNAFVEFPDGSRQNISMSNRNRLLFRHGLYNVFMGNQILQVTQDDGSEVSLMPLEDGSFDLKFPGEQFRVTPSDVPGLIDALVKLYEWDEEVQPLWKFYDEVLKDRVRIEVVNSLGEMYPFSELIGDMVEITSDGWLFYDKLLLSWDCEFRMPNRDMYSRSGTLIEANAAQKAFSFQSGEFEFDPVIVEIHDIPTRLSEKEMLFFTKSIWSIEQL